MSFECGKKMMPLAKVDPHGEAVAITILMQNKLSSFTSILLKIFVVLKKN